VTSGPSKMLLLVGPIRELSNYFDLVVELGWEEEKEKIRSIGEEWVHRYLKFILGKYSHVDKERDQVPTSQLTSVDWFLILDSLLLLSCNQQFCEIFGKLKTELSFRLHVESNVMGRLRLCLQCHRDCTLHTGGFLCSHCVIAYVDAIPQTCIIHNNVSTVHHSPCHARNHRYSHPNNHASKKFNCCSFKYSVVNKDTKCNTIASLRQQYGPDKELIPSTTDAYEKWVHVKIPNSLHDVDHLGHMPLEFCRLIERMS
jgi:hypothetical protein